MYSLAGPIRANHFEVNSIDENGRVLTSIVFALRYLSVILCRLFLSRRLLSRRLRPSALYLEGVVFGIIFVMIFGGIIGRSSMYHQGIMDFRIGEGFPS
jgi:hypothetical protein